MKELILGVDVSKPKLDVCYFSLEGKSMVKCYDNEDKGFVSLLKDIRSYKATKVHVCLEATGIYCYAVAEFLYEQGIEVSIVNPAKIKAFTRSKMMRNKTDAYDAQAIAEYCYLYRLISWTPDSKEYKELRDLNKCLNHYKDDRLRLINRLESCRVDSPIIKILKSSLRGINSKLRQIDGLIEKQIDKNPELKERKLLIESIPGFGSVASISILSQLPDLKCYDSARALAAHSGLTPMNFQSGSSVKKKTRISSMGSKKLRKSLYFPALTARRCNPILKAFADRLLARGKAKMVVIAAVMRKLLHIVYGVLKSGTSFKADMKI